MAQLTTALKKQGIKMDRSSLSRQMSGATAMRVEIAEALAQVLGVTIAVVPE